MGIPEKIITDKLAHYRKAYNIYFYRLRGSCKLVHGVPIGCKKYGLEHNNNCAERDNERIKQRYKTTTGFKNTESGEDLLKLMDNCYNFVHPHMGFEWKNPCGRSKHSIEIGKKQVVESNKNFLRF